MKNNYHFGGNFDIKSAMHDDYIVGLHTHGIESDEPDKATMQSLDILSTYEKMAKKLNTKVVFSLTDHNNTVGAKLIYEEIKQDPEKYKNVVFIPGVELSTDIGKAITYQSELFDTESYVFKQMHLLAYAKSNKKEEFFEKMDFISKIAHKSITLNNQTFSLGKRVLCARNKLCKTFKRTIPLKIYSHSLQINNYVDFYKSFVKDTLSYLSKYDNMPSDKLELSIKQTISQFLRPYIKLDSGELAEEKLYSDSDLFSKSFEKAYNKVCVKYSVKIPETAYANTLMQGNIEDFKQSFIEDTANYLLETVKKGGNEKKLYAKITRMIDRYFTPTPRQDIAKSFNEDGLGRIDIKDVYDLLKDCAVFCYAHPELLKFKKQAQLPAKLFEGIDISHLPASTKVLINEKLKKDPKFMFSSADILKEDGTAIKGDLLGLVRFQILNKALLKQGIKIDGYECTNFMLKNGLLHANQSPNSDLMLEYFTKVIVDELHLYPSYGTDTHYKKTENLNNAAKYELQNSFKVVESPLIKYIMNGAEKPLTNEQNSFSFHPYYGMIDDETIKSNSLNENLLKSNKNQNTNSSKKSNKNKRKYDKKYQNKKPLEMPTSTNKQTNNKQKTKNEEVEDVLSNYAISGHSLNTILDNYDEEYGHYQKKSNKNKNQDKDLSNEM